MLSIPIRAALRPAAFVLVAALSALPVVAQTPPAGSPDFSEAGRSALPAARLSEMLSGRVYVAQVANGNRWRMDFKATGLMYFDVSTGARDSAKWRTEDGQVCLEFRGNFPSSCGDWRLVGTQLWLKRPTGEVLLMKPE